MHAHGHRVYYTTHTTQVDDTRRHWLYSATSLTLPSLPSSLTATTSNVQRTTQLTRADPCTASCFPANRVDMCCQRLMRCCLGISLLFNYVLALIGVGACGYGVYLESQINCFSISVAGWGGLLALISLCYVCGGHRSTCYGCWYSALMTGFASLTQPVSPCISSKRRGGEVLEGHAKGADGLLNPDISG